MIGTGLLPSAFITQMSRLPDRLDAKAIRLPSGEYCGKWLRPVAAIRRSAGPVSTRPGPGLR